MLRAVPRDAGRPLPPHHGAGGALGRRQLRQLQPGAGGAGAAAGGGGQPVEVLRPEDTQDPRVAHSQVGWWALQSRCQINFATVCTVFEEGPY